MTNTRYFLSIFAAFLTVATTISARECEKQCFKATLCDIKHELKELNKSQPCSKIITAKDIGTTGYVIKKSGYYCLGENVAFAPASNVPTDPVTDIASVAITINADNVYLDLEKYELSQANGVPQCVGIQVNTGHDNVSIVNGSVSNFSYIGIYAQGGSSNIFLGNETSNLLVQDCGYGSVYSYYDATNGVVIVPAGVRLGESFTIAAGAPYPPAPYYLGPINTIRVTNLFAEENGPNGLFLGICSDAVFQNSSFSRNADTRVGFPTSIDPFGSAFGIGFQHSASPIYGDITPSVGITVQNCQFDENYAAGATQFVAGLLAGFNIEGLAIRNCTFSSNAGVTSGVPSEFGDGTFGCVVVGNTGIVVEDCIAANNSGPFATYGFHNSGCSGCPVYLDNAHGIVYRRCSSVGNTVSGLGQISVYGFLNGFAHGFVYEDCFACDNVGTTTDPDSVVFSLGLYAFGLDQPANGYISDGLVSGCQFTNNSVTGPNPSNMAGVGIGLYSPIFNTVIKDCVIQDNQGGAQNFGIQTVLTAAGDEFHNFVVERCTITNETIGISSGGDTNSIYQYNTITTVTSGIVLDGSNCCSVNNNYVTNAQVGFQDTTNPSTSLFANNRTFGVFPTPFDVHYAFGPVPVVNGSLTSGFPGAPSSPLDNVAVANPACAS